MSRYLGVKKNLETKTKNNIKKSDISTRKTPSIFSIIAFIVTFLGGVLTLITFYDTLYEKVVDGVSPDIKGSWKEQEAEAIVIDYLKHPKIHFYASLQ